MNSRSSNLSLLAASRRVGTSALVLVITFLIAFSKLNAQTTLPTTQPSATQLRTWITQLADDDPDVRESAAQSLMSLHSSDLPALRQAAIDLRPLLPGQIAALHDAVIQDYLATDDSQNPMNIGFLGLSWRENTLENTQGIVVADRIPGFGAYPLLRAGDVIVKILDQPNLDIRPPGQFTAAVRKLSAGQTLHLSVMRAGRLIAVPVVLKPCPQELLDQDVTKVSNWLNTRTDKAEQYWASQFGNLEIDVSAGGPDLSDPSSKP